MMECTPTDKVLEIGIGTGTSYKYYPMETEVTGIDISPDMLEKAKKNIRKHNLQNKNVIMMNGEQLTFEDNSFDAITVAFGVRNFENLEKGLLEMKRVLRTNGKVIILEFSKPKYFPIKQLFSFYSNWIIPTFGKLISKDKRAYTYLPESVAEFPEGEQFHSIMKKVGYSKVSSLRLSGGISSIYMGYK